MKNRKKRSPLALTVIIIYILFLSVCCFSFVSAQFYKDVKAAVTGTVLFENAEFKKTESDIRLVIEEGETEKLAKFTSLRSVDFSGSGCLDEIMAWSEAHPEVAVVYSVVMPDGAVISSESREIDISSVRHESVQDYINKLYYLPNAGVVKLGSSEVSALGYEDVTAFMEAYPQKLFPYMAKIGDVGFDVSAEQIDLTRLGQEDIGEAASWLSIMRSLSQVELGDEHSCSLSLEDISKLSEFCPQARFNYSFTLYGTPMSLDAELVDLNHIAVDDNADAVVAALKCMPNCKKLDMDYCGVDDLRMEEIRGMFPEVEVVWRIWFGTCYSVRTDTERILASRPSVGGMLDDTVGEKLKYCTKVRYLDLGHNDMLTDISFVRYMPDLEVFIIAINSNIRDISPLAFCPKLEYLEINSTPVSDLSCLSSCTGLHHLNIGCTQVRDISPVYNCTELERLWIGIYTEVPDDQVQRMQQAAPACVINTKTEDPHGDEWRWDYYDESMFIYHYVPRYELLREQMGYTYSEYSYYWKDPLCGDPCPPQYVGTSPDGIIEKNA